MPGFLPGDIGGKKDGAGLAVCTRNLAGSYGGSPGTKVLPSADNQVNAALSPCLREAPTRGA